MSTYMCCDGCISGTICRKVNEPIYDIWEDSKLQEEVPMTLWDAIKQLEEKITGLEAELSYWKTWCINNGWVNGTDKEKAPDFHPEPWCD